MAGKPVVDRLCLVGGQVVADQAHVEFGRHGFVDRDEERLELDGPGAGDGSG